MTIIEIVISTASFSLCILGAARGWIKILID